MFVLVLVVMFITGPEQGQLAVSNQRHFQTIDQCLRAGKTFSSDPEIVDWGCRFREKGFKE